MNGPFNSLIKYQTLSILTAVVILLGLGGCTTLFQGTHFMAKMRESFESDYSLKPNKVELLKPVPRNRESVHLEIFIIERPLFDPLMGNKLWKEVDQIAGIDAVVRQNLKNNGFLIGRVGSRPPVALQSLLGLTSDFDESSSNSSKGLNGREIFLTPGNETIIMAGSTITKCQFRIDNQAEEKLEEFSNANCVFRVRAERLQDGFANLKFIPEVRHGENRYRHLATDEGWVGRTSQSLAPFFQQQFELNLNIGEMAIISADVDKTQSLGSSFFISYEENRIPTQRIIVIRLAEMKNMIPLYSDE